MTTRTPHKLNVNMPAGMLGLRGAASLQTAIGAGVKDEALAVRCMR